MIQLTVVLEKIADEYLFIFSHFSASFWPLFRVFCELTVIYICYREKAKSSRRTKSDKEVCNELREFMSVIGLPENRVPTLKELSEHGRFVGSFLFSVMVGSLPLIP